MKRIALLTLFLTVIAVFCAVATCQAFHVVLGWNHSPSADVINYLVYWGTQSGVYENVQMTPYVDEWEVTQDLTKGIWYYFVVTALDIEGLESDYSNEVKTDGETKQGDGLPPGPPGGCYIKTVIGSPIE